MKSRRSARLILLDPQGRLLLFHYHDGNGEPFWATAGGELKEGEDYQEAAARELAEETGFNEEIGPFLREREAVYAVTNSAPARWLERYYLVRCRDAWAPSKTGWTQEELSTIRSFRWWTLQAMLAEQAAHPERFKPAWLPEILREVQTASSHPPFPTPTTDD